MLWLLKGGNRKCFFQFQTQKKNAKKKKFIAVKQVKEGL